MKNGLGSVPAGSVSEGAAVTTGRRREGQRAQGCLFWQLVCVGGVGWTWRVVAMTMPGRAGPYGALWGAAGRRRELARSSCRVLVG